MGFDPVRLPAGSSVPTLYVHCQLCLPDKYIVFYMIGSKVVFCYNVNIVCDKQAEYSSCAFDLLQFKTGQEEISLVFGDEHPSISYVSATAQRLKT